MKKPIVALILLAVIVVLLTTLSGCGNMSLGFGNFEYNKIHVDTYHYSGCFNVEKWYENNNGIEVNTKEADSMFFSEGTYILLEDDCPFCDKGVK